MTLEAPTTAGATQTDTRTHYSTAIFTLTSDIASVWQNGELWTVEINGRTFSFRVPLDGDVGTLTDIAHGLALAIDADRVAERDQQRRDDHRHRHDDEEPVLLERLAWSRPPGRRVRHRLREHRLRRRSGPGRACRSTSGSST